MSLAAAPPPTGRLARHRILSPTAAVRVSPICLGAMAFGSKWTNLMGECTKETTFAILDHFYKEGGNFIDTANNYQDEESEQWLGEWMKARGTRDQMVIATKFTTCYRPHHRDTEILSNTTGNSTKNLHVSVRNSLRKLQTDYIDLLYVHWWDFTASIPELMQSLNSLVTSGKVLYLGVSDTPAWVVSKANEYARSHGFRQFSVYQGRWNAARRDVEREIIPMCRAEGMAIAPWGALGGGNFKTDEQRKAKGGRAFMGPTEDELKVSKVLERVAKRKNTLITSVAMAYVMQKTPYVFPICGVRTIKHLDGNMDALSVELTKEDIDEIEGATSFDVGFPQNFLTGTPNAPRHAGDIAWLKVAGYLDVVDNQQPIPPTKRGADEDAALSQKKTLGD
ncbi:MAG: hypothetical protein M1819_001403 [Sarea resinae]|nr:MAG: hypothetical protein M1819_001403 [Sarea resinae]